VKDCLVRFLEKSRATSTYPNSSPPKYGLSPSSFPGSSSVVWIVSWTLLGLYPSPYIPSLQSYTYYI